MDVLDTPNLSFTAHRIADGFNVKISEGVILKEGPAEMVGRFIFEVLSVCKAVGDLIYGSKAYKPVNFQDEVSAFFQSNQLGIDRKVPKRGSSGTSYKIDFRVWLGGTRAALIQSLSPQKNSGVRRKVNATFRMWADLQDDPEPRVSLLNDEIIQFRQEDVVLLKKVSMVHRWTNRADLLSILEQGNGRN